MLAAKFAGRIDRDTLVFKFELAAGHGDIACLKNIGEYLRLEAVGRQALLRIEEINLLGQDTRSNHFGDEGGAVGGAGRGEQRLLHGVGKIIHLPVTVLFTGNGNQLDWNFGGVTNHEGLPSVGMHIHCPIALGEEGVKEIERGLVVYRGLAIDADKTRAVKNPNVFRGVQAAADVIQNLTRFLQPVRERERHRRDMASGDRLDARDIRVRSDGLFYAARHKFFNLFGAGARPRRDDHRLFWGNVRVLALGHMGVVVYTPNDRANQQDSGDL